MPAVQADPGTKPMYTSHAPLPRTINVVLFGETGVGKSSLVNLIAGKEIARVSSSVNGCTLQSTRYDIPIDGTNVSIFDTIGLNAPRIGLEDYLTAIAMAHNLIVELNSAGGVHLLLFCMRAGRITQTILSNYRLFREVLCSASVPIALVFTGLEREEGELEGWWEREEDNILAFGLKSDGHACITTVRDGTHGQDVKYSESQTKMRKLLRDCALQNEAFSSESNSWFAKLLQGMKSVIEKDKEPKKRDLMNVLTSRCDLEPHMAKRIVDMIEEADSESTRHTECINATETAERCSAALSLSPSNPAKLLVERSKARAKLELWDDALHDADEAIRADPRSPWGYEQRHAVLHELGRFDEAIDAVNRMRSVIRESPDPEIRQLGEKHVSPSVLTEAIDHTIRDVTEPCPLVLIDVRSGGLRDMPQRMELFKSGNEFKELLSSLKLELDDGRIRSAVKKYFEYVMFSHVWEGAEPLYQDVQSVGSVWRLDSTPLNDKLRSFCLLVRKDGYRWAWSDTCCIDKTNSAVLNQSLKMMYKWYEASTATFVFLADVDPERSIGSLADSRWMTRAWTSQELLAPIVIRFYNRNWMPYLGDTRSNHKESPEIMQELTNATGLTRETIVSFNPKHLSTPEKLRLASIRNATLEEDIAYSLIGIFESSLHPNYGEGHAALGHLLEDVVGRSGDVKVLAWAGRSSPYNSCLPSTLSVYKQTRVLPEISDSEMDARVKTLKNSNSPLKADAMFIHRQITRLPQPQFSNRRLYLPCIIFSVKMLGVQGSGASGDTHYRVGISGIGTVDIWTSDWLSVNEPHRLVLVHPWIRDLCGSDDVSRSRLLALFTSTTPALELVVRLQQPFHALLLQRQQNDRFKRVATEHDIVVPGLDLQTNFKGDARTDVLEIM